MVPAQNMNLATPESLWSSATTFLERPKIAVVFRPSLECDQGLWESLGWPLMSLPFCILTTWPCPQSQPASKTTGVSYTFCGDD